MAGRATSPLTALIDQQGRRVHMQDASFTGNKTLRINSYADSCTVD